MGDIGTPELLIIVVVVVVLFGAKKLPDAARSLGRSLRIFKSEIKGLHDDDNPAPAVDPAAASPVAPGTGTGTGVTVAGTASTVDSLVDGWPAGSR
ncbi:Sec-independent protein translocase subunit TatA [Frankia sp. AiPs1]|uniref:Sec-independent protein translocase subunit TatA n=1 Tax=Frankia sp. AiPs1 TaxID=573493 RepID=UPI002043B1A3|nr:Sec-independent protein translocase subunit TatA [Frankia sp. AiPs1]MCM3925580.1 Sec-independent protein translocase subunit TatA [Frankia sp. AiPs1]